jgi:hypothetical protein
VSDDSLASDGRVGLHARTWSSENVDVRFDNFAVYTVNGGAGLATADPQAAGSDSSASEAHGSPDRSP